MLASQQTIGLGVAQRIGKPLISNVADTCIPPPISDEIYHPTHTLTFILTPDKTIVATPLSAFFIKYDHRNYQKQLDRLRDMVRNGKIKSIVDLIDYCKFRPGNYRDQMCGLELVPTKMPEYIHG